jgi:hypothetical protein
MRLGYFAMPLHPPGSDPARTMDDDLAQLATLDRLGYEEAWIGEHFTAPNHDPLMLAQRIAQLDQMARGRFARSSTPCRFGRTPSPEATRAAAFASPCPSRSPTSVCGCNCSPSRSRIRASSPRTGRA